MASTVYATGRVSGGGITITPSPMLAMQLRELGDGLADITIRKFRRNRTTRANAYLWGVVYALIAEHTGYTREETHEICKAKFLPREVAVCDGNGEVVDSLVIGGSTAKLDTEQFAGYVQRIREWARDMLGVEIPEPATVERAA